MFRYLILIYFLISLECTFASENDSIINWQQKLNTLDLSYYQKAELAFTYSKNCLKNNDFINALNFSTIAENNFSKTKNEFKLGILYEHIGTIYSEVNEYKKSTDLYLKSIAIFLKYKDQKKVAAARMNLILMYLKINAFKKALYLINLDADFYSKNRNNNKIITDYYFTKGIILGSLNQLDSSLFYLKKCSNFYKNTNDYTQYGGLLNNIGAIYSKQEKNKEAFYYYNKALIYFKKYNIQRGIGVSLSNIAFLYKKDGKLKPSLNLYLESIIYFKKSNSTFYLKDMYSNIIELYKKSNNLKEAVKYYEIRSDLEAKLATAEVISKIAQVELLHQIKQKEQKFQLREQENTIKQNNLIIVTLISISLFILIIFVVFYLKQSLQKARYKEYLLEKERNELSSELVHSNRELEKFAIKIIEKNELLEQLMSNTKNHDSAQNDELKLLSKSISHNLYLDNDRKDLELQIDRVHQKFLLKLYNSYPNLTKNEVRLCSLLLLDLSSKDISTILNISPESVKKNRNRLRKSLNLINNQNIKEFLMNL